MQQFYLTQAGQPNAANQAMHFCHGRKIAMAPGHC